MDWIHCNKCFVQLGPSITLHLTSCGHMFCNKCLDNDVKESVCIVCQLPCSIMKLVPDMKPEVQDYFTEPEEIIKKSCEVLQFQKQHRRRLVSYLFQSTKKFYSIRNEYKRMSELCQRQHQQIKDYKNTIKSLESELHKANSRSAKQLSPFNIPLSQRSHVLSPNLIQGTPSYKRPAKSTPYNCYQSNLVTPSRISKQRSNISMHSQKSSNPHRMSSTMLSPLTPESDGRLFSQSTHESGYLTNSPTMPLSPGIVYCNGFGKCSFKGIK